MIPLEQGSVFRLNAHWAIVNFFCLNPFGTGQCLPTPSTPKVKVTFLVSIPLEQGSVFRPYC